VTDGVRQPDAEEPRIDVVGEERFALQGDVHLLITFLNKMLKDRGLIFGLTRPDDQFKVTIYEVFGPKK
jgi:hypothetical protein